MSDVWRGQVADGSRAAAAGIAALHTVTHVSRTGDPDPVTGEKATTMTEIEATVRDEPATDIATRGDEPEPRTTVRTFARNPIIRTGDSVRFQGQDLRVIAVTGPLVLNGAPGERWNYRAECGVR